MEDVRAALSTATANSPKDPCRPGADAQHRGQRPAHHAAQYRQLIIGYNNGAAVRLSDVARSSTTSRTSAPRLGGRPARHSAGHPAQPGANIIDVDGTREGADPGAGALDQSRHRRRHRARPQHHHRASVVDVERTLLLSIGLVVLVVFLFLRNVRATPSPASQCPSPWSAPRRHVPVRLQPGQPLAHGATISTGSWWTTPSWSPRTSPGSSRRRHAAAAAFKGAKQMASPSSRSPCRCWRLHPHPVDGRLVGRLFAISR